MTDFSIPDVCIERLQEEFNQLDCTNQQRDRMEAFFRVKRAMGELKQDDLINICELGQGNGGIVWKVRHKPTDIIMARKVRLCPRTTGSLVRHAPLSFKIIYLEVKPSLKSQIIRELKVVALPLSRGSHYVSLTSRFFINAIHRTLSDSMEHLLSKLKSASAWNTW